MIIIGNGKIEIKSDKEILREAKERQQVMETIDSVLLRYGVTHGGLLYARKDLFALTYPNGQPMLAVLAEKQEVPEYPNDPYIGNDPDTQNANEIAEASYLQAIQDMAKSGWRRCL